MPAGQLPQVDLLVTKRAAHTGAAALHLLVNMTLGSLVNILM